MVKSPELYVVWGSGKTVDGQFKLGGHGTDTLPNDEWKGVISSLIYQAVSKCLDLDPLIVRYDFDANVLFDGKMRKVDSEFRQALMQEYYTRMRASKASSANVEVKK